MDLIDLYDRSSTWAGSMMVADDASAQDKLIGYLGRNPA